MEKKTHVIVASVILSVLTWLSVSMNNEYSVAVRKPLRVSNLPDDMALASAVPRTILVRVHGTGWQIASSYLSTNSSINIDASNLDQRRTVLTSRELGYSLDLGSSAEVVSFTPDTVVIMLDKIISKLVPVVLTRVEVSPRSGFMAVGLPEVDPDSITISGARNLLNKIDSWQTEPKKFNNVINAINTKLLLPDSLNGLVQLSTREVNVNIDIQQIAENTYMNIPVRILNNKDSSKVLLLPPAVDLTIRGGINAMSDLTPDSFRVTVDFNDLANSISSHIQPNVELPATFQLIAMRPDSVEFVIRK
ncbi:MAG: YbbR-like domain-containing protein [Candidatus Kryptoniota bacterium]